jgi:hypothetical protein
MVGDVGSQVNAGFTFDIKNETTKAKISEWSDNVFSKRLFQVIKTG